MQRKQFIKDASLMAMSVAAFGNVRWTSSGYIADSPTTTDILGPFYRPGAPLRNNLNPPGFTGKILTVSGTVYHHDGRTPTHDGLLEVWQCKADGLYDNLSGAYDYRASQKIKSDGAYRFITTLPIPYPTDATASAMRPAHIHMRISVPGQQDLITQIYLKDDPYLPEDPSTKSPLTATRILPLTMKDKDNYSIEFNVVLQKESVPGDALFEKVRGVYKMSDGSEMEFYRDRDLLFYKTNGQIWGALAYESNNKFVGGVNDTEAVFELQEGGKVSVQFNFIRRRQLRLRGQKLFDYGDHQIKQ